VIARLRRLSDRYLPNGALLLAVLTLAAYAMGLVRDRLFARTFGLSHELDAYNAAFVLPELALDVLITSGLTAPFVPIFLAIKEGRAQERRRRETAVTTTATGEGSQDPPGSSGPSGDAPGDSADDPADRNRAAHAFGQSVLTLAIIVMAITSAILFVLAPQTTALIAPGFTPEQQAQYVQLFRLTLITPIAFGASTALGEITVAEQRFLSYGLAPLLYNTGIVIGTVTLSGRLGIYGPALGAVAGSLAHLGVRLVGAWRSGYRPWPRLDFGTGPVREFIRLMLPKMLSQPIEPVTFLVFTSLATTISAGAVSAVSFARNFDNLPVSLIGIAFSIAAFPTLSIAAADGDRRRFVGLVRRDAMTIGALSVVAAAGLWFSGGFLIRTFLVGGAFTESDAATTTRALEVFAISIPFESLFYLFSRAIYATHNTLLAVLSDLGGFFVTVALAFALSGALGIVAIPLAFTVGTALKVVFLGLALVPRVQTIALVPATTSAPRR
jgi:putative peptidoglycan lipid II flippase